MTFDAEGCGATIAAGSACVLLAQGGAFLDAARIRRATIEEELGGLSPESSTRPTSPPMRCTARLRRPRAGGATLAEPDANRVLVGLSGGVDSAVAAHLCARGGREVVAVTLKLWADQEGDGERSCCSPQAVWGRGRWPTGWASRTCTLDVEDRFRAAVVGDYISEHAAGRTPNPCVRCNGLVRFDAMLGLADRLGASALATGHYARIADDGEGPLLARAADRDKDQTYMLAGLRPELLRRLRFPLGDLTKPQVRAIARDAHLSVAEKRESQDLCFLAGTSRERFLARHAHVRDPPGDVVDTGGRVLGRHRGHHGFTVGQRKGLGVAAGEPLYVVSTDAPRQPGRRRAPRGRWRPTPCR